MPLHGCRLAYNDVMQRLRAVSTDLTATASQAAAASRQGAQVVIEDAAGRTVAIVGATAADIFGSDTDAWTESDEDDGDRLIASSGSVDFGQSWRS